MTCRIVVTLAAACLLMATGCQPTSPGERGLDGWSAMFPGNVLKSIVAQKQDNQAYSQASPSARFDIDDTPGMTSESWETAHRDYPNALPKAEN